MNSLSFVTSKLGNVKPKTRSIADEVYNAAKAAGHEIWFMWGMGPGKEHGSGYALDLMVHNEAAGDWVRNYIWANRARFRLRHVIWEQHVTSTVISPGVRRLMADRGSPTENHYDHNHVWFFPGLYVPPSDKPAPLPKPTKPPAVKPVVKVRVLAQGSKGSDVGRLQRELKRLFPAYASRLVADEEFGPKTAAVVREFQIRVKLRADAVVGSDTRAALKKLGARL